MSQDIIPKRMVSQTCTLIPLRGNEPPSPGSKVFALTHGRRIVEVIWTSESHKHYDAYMHYPAVPDEITKLQWERFSKTGEFAITTLPEQVNEQQLVGNSESDAQGTELSPSTMGDGS